MGELFAILSALLFSSANVMVTRGVASLSQDNGVFLSILLTVVIAGAAVLVRGLFGAWPVLNAAGILWFCLAGVFTAFLGRVFLYSSIQHLGSVRAVAIKRLQPFFAVLIGVLLLGEAITGALAGGMLLIFVSFVILVMHGYRTAAAPGVKGGRMQAVRKLSDTIINLGYLFGPISALAYAFGYFWRKKGLLEIPDPFFGTMVGAIVGALVFLALGLFQARSRNAIRLTFTEFRPWLFAAGVASSVGQILYFLALKHSAISRVALISSMEVFFTIFLSVWVFKTQERLGLPVAVAALLGITGTIMIVY